MVKRKFGETKSLKNILTMIVQAWKKWLFLFSMIIRFLELICPMRLITITSLFWSSEICFCHWFVFPLCFSSFIWVCKTITNKIIENFYSTFEKFLIFLIKSLRLTYRKLFLFSLKILVYLLFVQVSNENKEKMKEYDKRYLLKTLREYS